MILPTDTIIEPKFPIGAQVKLSKAGKERFRNAHNLDRVFTVVKYDRTGGIAKVSHPTWKLLNNYSVRYLELA